MFYASFRSPPPLAFVAREHASRGGSRGGVTGVATPPKPLPIRNIYAIRAIRVSQPTLPGSTGPSEMWPSLPFLLLVCLFGCLSLYYMIVRIVYTRIVRIAGIARIAYYLVAPLTSTSQTGGGASLLLSM